MASGQLFINLGGQIMGLRSLRAMQITHLFKLSLDVKTKKGCLIRRRYLVTEMLQELLQDSVPSPRCALTGLAANRSLAVFVLSPDVFEQLHLGSPIHRHLRPGLRPRQSSRLDLHGGAKSNGQKGPAESIEIK